MQALNCLVYLAVMGIIVFLLGRFFPRKWILEDCFPFNDFTFEKKGTIYEKIKIRKWKNKWPDASKTFNCVLGKFYPKKQIDKMDLSKSAVLIKESCIAEATHAIVIFFGLLSLRIWRGIGGGVVCVLWTAWNVPPIIIQRYNRPRLKRAQLLTAKKTTVQS